MVQTADDQFEHTCRGVFVCHATTGRAEVASGEDTDFVRDMMAFDDLKPSPIRRITDLGVRLRMAAAALRVGAEA